MKQHKLFYGSSYDRGLDILLFMWPEIRDQIKDAELHICYGWETYDQLTSTNPERREWKKNVQMLMDQEGIVHHGRVGKKDIQKIRSECGIWAYPTYFSEINCITALESQKDGLVPVTMDSYALKETVGSGVKIKGSIRELSTQEEYLHALINMMRDKEMWESESKKAKKFAKNYYWTDIAKKWRSEFDSPVMNPFVSIVTITIREGWWNIMAENLSKQTYGNFEWIIVDDHKEDRKQIAEKYAKKYNLNIRYIRGDKAKGTYKRHYGLVRSNNIAWKAAKGELMVFIQDFILIQNYGIERLVDIYRHNPKSIIAPTDVYYYAKEIDEENREDWWSGDLSVCTDVSWTNIRNEYKGMRKTDNPYDFEMNWGAIPKALLDELHGWWEFFDNGMGYDNAEIAYRAMKRGYEIILDDTNVAKCLDLDKYFIKTDQDVQDRDKRLAIPYWVWLTELIKSNELPTIRDPEIDARIDFDFMAPDGMDKEDTIKWIRENAVEIAKQWKK